MIDALWAKFNARKGELKARMNELLKKQLHLIDAEDWDGFDANADEYERLHREYVAMYASHADKMASYRDAPERMQ
jgi:hypothetical protein